MKIKAYPTLKGVLFSIDQPLIPLAIGKGHKTLKSTPKYIASYSEKK